MSGDGQSRPKVLIADHHAESRGQYCRILQSAFAVEVFSGAASALSYCSKHQVAAVLFSPSGFDLTPLDFLRGLSTIDPQIPLVILMEEKNDAELPGLLQAGAYDVLQLPISEEYLLHKVKQAIRNAGTQRELHLYSSLLRRTHRYSRSFFHDLASPLATLLNTLAGVDPLQITAVCGANCRDLAALYRHFVCQEDNLPDEDFDLELLLRCAYSCNSELAMSKGIRVKIDYGQPRVRLRGSASSLMEILDYLLRVAMMLCHERAGAIRVASRVADKMVGIVIENEQQPADAEKAHERIRSARAAASDGLTDYVRCENLIKERWQGSIKLSVGGGKICHEVFCSLSL